MPRSLFQYQGFVEPPRTPAPPPDLSWSPRYPERCPRAPSIPAAILAGSLFFLNFVPVAPPAAAAENFNYNTAQTSAAQVDPPVQIQYQAQASIFYDALTPPVATTLEWLPSYPDRLQQPWSAAGMPATFAETASVRPLGHVSWLLAYPDRVLRLPWSQPVPVAFVPEVAAPATDQGISLGTTQVFPDPQVQYQSRVSPFPGQRAQIEWLPTYPERIPRPTVRAADQRAAFIPTYLPIHDLRWQGSFPEQIRAAARLPVYPALVFDPYPIPPVEVVTYAAAYYPDRLSRLVLPPLGGLSAPPPSVRPLGHVAWLPAYPDAIRWGSVRAADQQAFVQPRYLPIADLRWQGTFPDRIDRREVRAADQQALFAPRYLPIADLRWAPSYPDRIVRPTLRAADHPAFVWISYQPINDLRWQGVFPALLNRRVAQPHLWPVSVLNIDPIANEPAPLLSWHPMFPDRIDRRVMLVSLIPFHDVRNLDPIPNDAVGGSQIITIGLEIGITDYPVLGGWVPF
jgi:hypothetical protein